jgi:hypothetical protein
MTPDLAAWLVIGAVALSLTLLAVREDLLKHPGK